MSLARVVVGSMVIPLWDAESESRVPGDRDTCRNWGRRDEPGESDGTGDISSAGESSPCDEPGGWPGANLKDVFLVMRPRSALLIMASWNPSRTRNPRPQCANARLLYHSWVREYTPECVLRFTGVAAAEPSECAYVTARARRMRTHSTPLPPGTATRSRSSVDSRSRSACCPPDWRCLDLARRLRATNLPAPQCLPAHLGFQRRPAHQRALAPGGSQGHHRHYPPRAQVQRESVAIHCRRHHSLALPERSPMTIRQTARFLLRAVAAVKPRCADRRKPSGQ
jgi:hypothetical protein